MPLSKCQDEINKQMTTDILLNTIFEFNVK